ncbi:MAG: hypothetical protein JRN10_02210 [Nitrososphaerota archaeon]|jgi:biotin synthase|nr:hypothetical protein [Nitrososphaerota archaeon]
MTLKDALNSFIREKGSLQDAVELYNSTNSPERYLSLFTAATEIRDERLGRELTLHGHLGMITACPLNPPCLYCSVSTNDPDEKKGRNAMSLSDLRKSAVTMKERGMAAIHLVGGTRLEGLDESVKRVVSAIREDIDIPLEISVGPSLSVDTVRWLKAKGIFRIVCSIETINEEAFAEAKPADSLPRRIDFMNMLEREGVQLKSIVMNGLGSTEDLVRSIYFLRKFRNLTSVSVSTFTPIRGTPWANRRPASVWDSLKAMAVARLLFPDADVGLAFGGGVNFLPVTLMAGGGNTLMGMLIDHAKSVDNTGQIASIAGSFGFTLKQNRKLQTS